MADCWGEFPFVPSRSRNRALESGPAPEMKASPSLQPPLILPGVRAVVRHSMPNVIEGKIIPIAVFLGFLKVVGTTGALLAALAWSSSAMFYRMATGRKVPGLVILSTIGLTARTIAALATGSLVVYFLQPTISTGLVGLAFLISVPMGKPLAERLAHDFCPFEPEMAEHPMLKLFFLRLSLLWAVTSLVNAAFTLWLLLTQSATTFVVIKSFTGPSFTAVTLLLAVGWFRFAMKRIGLSVEFGSTMAISQQ